MFKLFNMTREQLMSYVGKGTDSLYNNVVKDSKTLWKNTKDTGKTIATVAGWIKKK